MRAKTGDQLVTHGRTVGARDQVSEIIEVLGANGEPPYRVRTPDGHETLTFPGPDSEVKRPSRARAKRRS